MWAKPTKADWKSLPKLYSTEKIPLKDKIIHWHFFLSGGHFDWYIAEGDEATGMLFGFCIVGDMDNAEWGNVSFQELSELKAMGMFEVDFDKHWTKRKASEVDNIVACRRGV